MQVNISGEILIQTERMVYGSSSRRMLAYGSTWTAMYGFRPNGRRLSRPLPHRTPGLIHTAPFQLLPLGEPGMFPPRCFDRFASA